MTNEFTFQERLNCECPQTYIRNLCNVKLGEIRNDIFTVLFTLNTNESKDQRLK